MGAGPGTSIHSERTPGEPETLSLEEANARFRGIGAGVNYTGFVDEGVEGVASEPRKPFRREGGAKVFGGARYQAGRTSGEGRSSIDWQSAVGWRQGISGGQTWQRHPRPNSST